MLGATLLVAGIAAKLQVSAAVGAFLVGIAISGPVAHQATELLTPLRDLFAAVFFVFFGLSTDPRDIPPVLLPALVLAVVTMATKVATGYLAARRAGIAEAGRWRAGLALMPRGEFSIVIAGLAVTAERRGRAPAGAAGDRVRPDHRGDRPAAGPAARLPVVPAPGSANAAAARLAPAPVPYPRLIRQPDPIPPVGCPPDG